MPDLVRVAPNSGSLRASAVFFHGLGGDLFGTWRCGAAPTTFWPSWRAEDIEGLAIWSGGYEAPISRWRGAAMHLTDRATSILARLLAEPGLREGPLILIGHSLGGLVI